MKSTTHARKESLIHWENGYRLPRVLRGAAIAAVAAAGACLAACQTTADSRWAERQDSVDTWKPRLAAIPIDVHGALADEVLASIPNGTNEARYGLAQHSATLASVQRIELYVGGDTVPIGRSYCETTPTPRPAPVESGKVRLAAALCDGSRLIVTVRLQLEPSTINDIATMNRAVQKIKSEMAFSLSVSDGQVPTEEPG